MKVSYVPVRRGQHGGGRWFFSNADAAVDEKLTPPEFMRKLRDVPTASASERVASIFSARS